MTSADDWSSKVAQPCCQEWEAAHKRKTDNEGYGPLVGYDDGSPNGPMIGSDLPRVRFCPWCGTAK